MKKSDGPKAAKQAGPAKPKAAPRKKKPLADVDENAELPRNTSESEEVGNFNGDSSEIENVKPKKTTTGDGKAKKSASDMYQQASTHGAIHVANITITADSFFSAHANRTYPETTGLLHWQHRNRVREAMGF